MLKNLAFPGSFLMVTMIVSGTVTTIRIKQIRLPGALVKVCSELFDNQSVSHK